jgi:hypothetical protein
VAVDVVKIVALPPGSTIFPVPKARVLVLLEEDEKV